MNNVDRLDYHEYGPGDDFKINTNNLFHVRIQFIEENGQFGRYITAMTQARSYGIEYIQMEGNCGSLNAMTGNLRDGMAFAFSNWGTYDNWLWKDRCQAGPCNGSHFEVSNLSIDN